ncbi:MAG: class I SAM-dependent methyltransferase [Synechococcus sp.]
MATPTLTEIAYRTLQQSRSIAGLAHKEISTKLMQLVAPDVTPSTEPVPNEMLMELRQEMANLEDLDWREAEQGVYPKSQLFDLPWIDWATRYPRLWLDLPSTWTRRRERNVHDLPDHADEALYPDYYLQNFHHQTDGYLSDHSAELYDLQVDILFNGAADAMRRRVITPLKRGLRRFEDRPAASLKVLDVATGTGRTLQQIRAALPDTTLVGLDLSQAYLRQANRWLNQGDAPLVQLLQGNGESIPLADGSIQAVTCVFLLHELPAEARQAVINECYRVLEPGGVLVLADSIQLADSPQFELAMDNFRKAFHEPYYRDYISDDIDNRLLQAGFMGLAAESHFMTRIWTATKPPMA